MVCRRKGFEGNVKDKLLLSVAVCSSHSYVVLFLACHIVLVITQIIFY